MGWGSFKYVIYKICLEIIYLICMYKKDLALNDLKWLIGKEIKPSQIDMNPKISNCLLTSSWLSHSYKFYIFLQMIVFF